MNITQEQLDALSSPLRKKRIKLELLDKGLKVIDVLEGYAVDGSIAANANNTIRRSGSLTIAVPNNKSAKDFLSSLDGLDISVDGKLWIDNYIKIYVGLDRNNGTVWYKLGVFLIDKPALDFGPTQYQISFNCIDRMIELTGERQGQLTGIGTTILAGEYVEGQQFLTNGIYPKASALNPNQRQGLKCAFGNNEVAVLLDGSPYIQFYLTDKGAPYYARRQNLIPVPTSQIMDINYSPDGEHLAVATNGSGVYIYNKAIRVTTLTTNVLESNSVSYNQDGTYLAIASGSNIVLYSISGGIYTYDTIIDTGFAAISKCKFSYNGDYLFVTQNETSFAPPYTSIIAISMSTKTIVNVFPSELYNTYISNISDFDIDETDSKMTLILDNSPYIVCLDTTTTPFSLVQSPFDITEPISSPRCKFFNGGNNLAISQESLTNDSNFYVYDTTTQPYTLLPSPIATFYTYLYNTTTPGMICNDFAIDGNNLFIAGMASTPNNALQYGASFTIQNADLYMKTTTMSALEAVIKNLTNIKKYTIQDIPEDYKYLPYDIKVGTSATVWDILKQFNDILSTWQFYFDNDGVFRIEPLPSGKNDAVYPLSDETYIADNLSYEFNNVKNQVVVYGKINQCTYYTEDITYENSGILNLRFDSLIKDETLTLRGTTFGFLTPNNVNNTNLTKLNILSGELWQQTATSNINGTTKSYFYNGKWYYVTSQSVSQGGVYSSTDGVAWEQTSSYTTTDLAYGNSLLVSSTQNGIYWQDTDETWNLATGSGTSFFNCITFGGNLFVAGSNTLGIYYSSDGKSWTQSNLNSIKINNIAYVECIISGVLTNKWIASTENGLYYSVDGQTWSISNITTSVSRKAKSYIENYDSLLQTGTGYIMVEDYYSTDGEYWDTQLNNFYVNSFEFFNDKLVGVDSQGNVCIGYTVLTNIEWAPIYSDIKLNKVIKLNDNLLLGVSTNGLYSTADGIHWKYLLTTPANIQTICTNNPAFCLFTYNNIYYFNNLDNSYFLSGNLVAFENSEGQVAQGVLQPNEVYVVRVFNGTTNIDGTLNSSMPVIFELYSRQQPSACLVDDNIESPFYINKGLRCVSFYAGTAETSNGYDFGEEYKLTLNNNEALNSLEDCTQITFMANYTNSADVKISVYNKEGTALVTDVPLVDADNSPIGAQRLTRDYTIHLIEYNATNGVFVYKGITPTAYSLVLSGGEYDNIHSDQLAYERCLWELYQHSNMQDNIVLQTVPNYALDVNMKIPYDPATVGPKGANMPSEQQYFLTKQVSYPLSFGNAAQQVSAVRIYDDGGLLGDN